MNKKWNYMIMKKLICSIILLITLSGCGFQNFFIRNIDYYISSKITGKLHLYSKQEDQLDKDITVFLNQQKEHAKQLITIVTDTDITNSITRNLIEVRKYYYLIARDLSRIISKNMEQLDQNQITEFLNNIRKENQDLENEIAEFDLQKSYKFLNNFIGSLTDEQRKLVEEYRDYLKMRQVERHKKRIATYAKIAEIYQSKQNIQLQFNQLFDSLNDPEKAKTPSLNDQKIYELVDKVRLSLTDKQKKYFNEKKQEVLEMLKYFISYKYE